MTSTGGVGESAIVASHTAQRDFLLQRLMEDAERLRGNGAARTSPIPATSLPRSTNGQRRRKGAPLKNGAGTGSSSSTTAEDTDRDSEENEDAMVKPETRTVVAADLPRYRQQKMFSSGLQLFSNPLHQYAAATLAAAQFMQAAAGFPPISGHQPTVAALPLLDQYPMLYRSLFPGSAFGNGGGIGTASSTQFPSPNSESAESGTKTNTTPSKTSTPGATEKRMASISLASPKQSQSTPSPRKRPPPKIKESTKVHSPAPASGGGTPKKARAIRRIQFDDEMCSPVSGMYIKDLDEMPAQSPSSQGDSEAAQPLLDDSALWVKITDEAKAELAKIPNLIGDYICRLCKVRYADAFQLAKHRCPRIAHEEYRCPECDKVFSCPANLASHRRWHKPKDFVNVADCKPDDDGHDSQGSPGSTEQLAVESVDDSSEQVPNNDSPIDLSNTRPAQEAPHNGNGATNGHGNGHGTEQSSAEGEEDDEAKSQAAQLIVSTPSYHECQTCGKRFDAHRWLRAHALAHTSFNKTDSDENGGDHESTNGDSEVQCSESGCRLWFLSADALEKHQRRAHPKFVCKFCTQSFPTSPALTRHINRQHPAPVGECRVILLPQSPPSRT